MYIKYVYITIPKLGAYKSNYYIKNKIRKGKLIIYLTSFIYTIFKCLLSKISD
jgi:hypothetical protein